MRLIVHGQQEFAAVLLQTLLDKGVDEIVAVYCAPDDGDTIDPLKALAVERGLALYQPSTFKDPAIWEQMAAHDADLCVMAHVTLFVPEEALDAPRFGSIQFHPSLLPDHRGPSSLNWAIIMGRTQTGLSVFWPDNGLDTGPVLMQKTCEIDPDDTFGSVYDDHLFPDGVEAMMESIELVRAGKAPREPQDLEAGSYESWCTESEAEIDWSRSADEIYNLVRGCNPTPGAWSLFEGDVVRIYDCELAEPVDAEPGTLVAMSDRDVTIAMDTASLKVSLMSHGDQAPQSASAWYQNTPNVRLNDRFGGTEADSQSSG